jgi:hypothetical protein
MTTTPIPEPAVETGRACALHVRRALVRAVMLAGGKASASQAALVEASARLSALHAPLQGLTEYERTRQRLAESSTTLAMLQSDLARLGGPTAAPPGDVSAAVAEAALEAARSPHDPFADLPDAPLTVTFRRLRPVPPYTSYAELRIVAGGAVFTLGVWSPGALDGPWKLTGARARTTPFGVAFDADAGTLTLHGLPVLVAGAPAEAARSSGAPAAEMADARVVAADALLERMNTRARWDYELDADDTPGVLLLRGSSGMYEHGCRIVCSGVFGARVSASFSHASFQRIPMSRVPPALRPESWDEEQTGMVALEIEAESGSSSAEHMLIVARRLRFEDDDGPPEQCVFDSDDIAPPAPVRDAALRRRRDALENTLHAIDAGALPADDLGALLEALDAAPDPPVPERARQDARAAVAEAAMLHSAGRRPPCVAIDLRTQTVGRVLADPGATAALDDVEQDARAAALYVLGAGPMHPDPAWRARIAHVAEAADAALADLDAVVEALARWGSVSANEWDGLVEEDRVALGVLQAAEVLPGAQRQ